MRQEARRRAVKQHAHKHEGRYQAGFLLPISILQQSSASQNGVASDRRGTLIFTSHRSSCGTARCERTCLWSFLRGVALYVRRRAAMMSRCILDKRRCRLSTTRFILSSHVFGVVIVAPPITDNKHLGDPHRIPSISRILINMNPECMRESTQHQGPPVTRVEPRSVSFPSNLELHNMPSPSLLAIRF